LRISGPAARWPDPAFVMSALPHQQQEHLQGVLTLRVIVPQRKRKTLKH